MTTRRLRGLQLLAIAIAASQAGHLLAYQARFGGAALTLERSGAHAYFLPMLTWLGGAAGAAALAALLAVAWARVFGGRRLGLHAAAGWSAADLLPPLFVLQLAVYAGQETLESVAYGVNPPALVDLLLWGALGQLPAAAAGALALAWLSTRLEGALEAVDIRLAQLRPLLLEAGRPAPSRSPFSPAAVLAQCAPAAFVKRGPPHTP